MGLDYLERAGAIEKTHHYAAILPELIARNRAATAELPFHRENASLLFGDLGTLLLAMRLTPASNTADALFERAAANSRLPIVELMWGLPGSMLACIFMHEMTGGEPRWQSLYGEQATRLIDELEETDGGPLWTQDLYGERVRCLGAVHGFAGNMIAPLRGWEWLTPAQRERVSHTAERTLAGYCNGGRSAVGDPCMPAGSPLR